ncbi:hypothetical protein KPC190_01123 [Klebsiella pneumoniae]|nr:hypothetical protein [Klebsiella pneumoniae]MCB8863738.1 hypothetical protein [Klebsiella pneumoniae]
MRIITNAIKKNQHQMRVGHLAFYNCNLVIEVYNKQGYTVVKRLYNNNQEI